MILKFFNKADSLYIALIVIRDVFGKFPRPRNQPLTDVVMDGLLGYLGPFNQVADLQGNALVITWIPRCCHRD